MTTNRGDRVPRDERWTVADEQFEAFVDRPLKHQLRMRLLREAGESLRPADFQLAREKRYDQETERLRAVMQDVERVAS